jgi:hypothetical protein
MRIAAVVAGLDAPVVAPVGVAVHQELGPPKWFITLRHGRHGPPFEDDPSGHDALVRATTTAFWDLQLKSDRRAAQHIVNDVRRSGRQAKLQYDTGSLAPSTS